MQTRIGVTIEMTEEGLLDRSRCEIETRSARLTDLKHVINLDAQIFSVKEILDWARPPPFWRKNPKKSQFFLLKSFWIG